MRIAIVGSGISGLVCGYLLAPEHEITLFEANDYLGGHTHTVDVPLGNQTFAVDTGFIVFNDRTYPRFNRLLDRLEIRPQPTEMSFSVRHDPSGFEYNGHDLNSLFAQRRHLLSPRFYCFIKDILRFNRQARRHLAEGRLARWTTLGEYLQAGGYGEFFIQRYILPMGAAIWSASLSDMRRFPLAFFLRFFEHHGLLNVLNRPQWYVLPGGSRSYIEPLTRGWQAGIRLATPVLGIRRLAQGAELVTAAGKSEFDAVILACHSDQALRLLQDASAAERQILAAMPYRSNEVVLHTDSRVMPRSRRAWASWNYLLDDNEARPAAVTYDMNRLQGLTASETFCVTLNRSELIDPALILGRFDYSHPVFTEGGIAAQARRNEICGIGSTHFCGAYWYNGFHEDGVRSALDVCARFGVGL